MNRSDVHAPGNFKNYVAKASDEDLNKSLRNSTKRFKKLLDRIPGKKINYAYDDDKWTIKQLLQHIIDVERVFVLRALWFGRKDSSPLPGFDENNWALHANVEHRKWNDMKEEFFELRAATERFFASLPNEILELSGSSNNNIITVGALGFVSAGHVEHHINIIEERYLPSKAKKVKEEKPKKVKEDKIKKVKEGKVKKTKEKKIKK